MHIVFIVSNYYPNYSAVGKCVGNIADVLEESHKITVICEKTNLKESYIEKYNNQQIMRILTKDKASRLKIEEKINDSKKTRKTIYKYFYKFYKSKKIIEILLSKNSIKTDMVNKYLDELKNINEPIDVIIPASMPFESVLAAVEYKEKYKNEVKVIPYLFDQFVENDSLHRAQLNKIIKRKNHSKIEMNTIKEADSLLILKQLQNYYMQNYKEYMNKFSLVEHPLLKKPTSNIKFEKTELSFIYAGSFYRKIRNPKYMLNMFDNILNEIEGTLNLYAFGNCSDIIKKFTMKNEHINDCGKVDTEKIYEKLHQHDFLVAVGNNDNKQVPSKIFEYISFGKPIIYFYSNKYDTNLEVLSRYNLAICLEQDLNLKEKNKEKILEFCRKNINNKISYKNVVDQFRDATPEYTANIINEHIYS